MRDGRTASPDGLAGGGADEAVGGSTTTTMVDRLVRLVLSAPPRAGATRVLAVDGPSGSGKSTLGRAVADALAGSARVDAALVRMDDLYPGWDGLQEAVPRLLEWVVEPLSRNAPARYRRYDWGQGRYAEWHDVPEVDVLVVEGVGAGARACGPHLSLLVWVEAPRELRFERGIERDGEGYRPYWERWAVQEQALFAADATRERADVRMSTRVPGRWEPLP